MFDLPCPKRFLRLSTAMLAMVAYRCMLPPINRRAGKIKHNKTLSGGPCSRFNTVLFVLQLVRTRSVQDAASDSLLSFGAEL